MSENLLIMPAKGCVHYVRRDNSENFYAINPPLKGSEKSPIIIDGAETVNKDSVFAVSTLDDKQFLYTFGKDFGDYVISGRILLGESTNGSEGMRPLVTWFKTNRLTNRTRPIYLAEPGGKAVAVAITQLAIGRPDPQFNIQVFSIRGLLIEPPAANR